jgi:hypothetical protein
MVRERARTFSWVFLVAVSLLGVIAWWMIPAMTAKRFSGEKPVVLQTFHAGIYFWGGWPFRTLVTLAWLACVLKEFLPERETLKLVLNVAFILLLLLSLMVWLFWLLGFGAIMQIG